MIGGPTGAAAGRSERVQGAVTGCGQLCVCLCHSLSTQWSKLIAVTQHTTHVTVFQHSFTHTNAPGHTGHTAGPCKHHPPVQGTPKHQQNGTERESVELGECVCQARLGVWTSRWRLRCVAFPTPRIGHTTLVFPSICWSTWSNHHHTHDGAHHDGDNFNPNESKQISHVSVCDINAT